MELNKFDMTLEEAIEVIKEILPECEATTSLIAERKVLNAVHNGELTVPKTGKWVKARGNWCTPGGDPVWECSECGKGTHVYGIEHGSYGADIADGQWVACPNCGAKMDGEI